MLHYDVIKKIKSLLEENHTNDIEDIYHLLSRKEKEILKNILIFVGVKLDESKIKK